MISGFVELIMMTEKSQHGPVSVCYKLRILCL